jgi:GH43 family beta-xylosidase
MTVGNKDFSLLIGYKTITGTVSMPETDDDGILIIACPASNTQMPHSFIQTASDDFHKQQDNFFRLKYPHFGTITRNNGTSHGYFTINVPANEDVNIYAYYSYVSITGSPANPNRTYLRYYTSQTNVQPGSTVSITGSWTPY